MKELNALNHVSAFHRTFRHPVVEQPAMPAPERCRLRLSLLAEELKELEDAVEQNDLVAAADALCDLQYVLSGAVLEFGLGNQFSRLFDEVQRSNMSKACKTPDEAEATILHYRENHNTESYYREVDGFYLVYRTSDNKTMKSVNYSPADLHGILEQSFAGSRAI